jgi:kexin
MRRLCTRWRGWISAGPSLSLLSLDLVRMRVHWLAAAAALAQSAISRPSHRSYDTHAYYALEHDPHASGASLTECAHALGVDVVEQVGELQNVWLVRVPHPTLSSRSAVADDTDPVLAALSVLRARAATEPSWSSLPHARRTASHAKRIVSAVQFLERQVPRQRVKRAPPGGLDAPTDASAHASSHDVAQALHIVDPEFDKQWHLVNDEFPVRRVHPLQEGFL